MIAFVWHIITFSFRRVAYLCMSILRLVVALALLETLNPDPEFLGLILRRLSASQIMSLQAILTGESASVEKNPREIGDEKALYQDKTCILFSVSPFLYVLAVYL